MRLWIFSLILLMMIPAKAQTDTAATDTLPVASKYEYRIERYRSDWLSLIPTQFILQNAGNMDCSHLASAGITDAATSGRRICS